MAVEYPALIYKNQRNQTFIANCIMKNMMGFGKTEEAALTSLKESLRESSIKEEIVLTPIYGFLF